MHPRKRLRQVRLVFYIVSLLTFVLFDKAYSSVSYSALQDLKEFNGCLKTNTYQMRNNLDFRSYIVFGR